MEPLITLKNLTQQFPSKKDPLTAVNNLSLEIYPNETLALVGESGAGKSAVGKAILKLNEPTAGKIFYRGKELGAPPRDEMQMIFQDPYASLNPRMRVLDLIGEALDIYNLASGSARTARVHELLELVGLYPEYALRYPHEFSGGQRQRIGIARALAVEPTFLVCDEPVSALDVSVQAQIIHLMRRLQKELGLTYLWITHDLSTLRAIADRVAVMYLGELVEVAPVEQFLKAPKHPYSQALLSAVPLPDPVRERSRTRIVLRGELPSPFDPPKGCPFHTRCPFAEERCRGEKPEWQEVGDQHLKRCHLRG